MSRARVFAFVAAAIVGLVVGGSGPANPARAAFPDGYVEIVNDHAHKCVDVTNRSTTIGTPLQEWSCTDGDEQLWKLIQFPNGDVAVRGRLSPNGYCMAPNGTTSGVRVVQTVCDYWWSDTNQLWRWQAAAGLGEWLVNVKTGLCLALSPNTSANGTSIVAADCSFTTAKYWHVETS